MKAGEWLLQPRICLASRTQIEAEAACEIDLAHVYRSLIKKTATPFYLLRLKLSSGPEIQGAI